MRLYMDKRMPMGYLGVFRIDGDQDTIFVAEAPTAAALARRGMKHVRCKLCENCLKPDCGVCVSCLDMPKFGGKGTQKQSCVHRRCLDLRTPSSLPLLKLGQGKRLGRFASATEAAVCVAKYMEGTEEFSWVQCDDCEKWRRLPKGYAVDEGAPWTCSMHPTPGEGCEEPADEMDEKEAVQTVEAPAGGAATWNWAQCDPCDKSRRLPAGVDAPGEDDTWMCSYIVYLRKREEKK